jgi:hypothetical protein
MNEKETKELIRTVINEHENIDDFNGFDDPTKAKKNLFKYNGWHL